MCSLMKMCMKEAASFPDRKCCWSSTLSSAQAPGFEWQGSVHSDWPHSSLSPPSSTGLQRGWGCCCGCSGRPSPGPPGCVTPLRSCCCPPPSSPGSRLRGSPRWTDTPVWHCPAAAPLWRGGGGSGWDAPHPLEERERGGEERGEKRQSHESEGLVPKKNPMLLISSISSNQTEELVLLLLSQISQYQTITHTIQVEVKSFMDEDYWGRLHLCFLMCDSEELVPVMIFFCFNWQSSNTHVNPVQTFVICLFHFLFTTCKMTEAWTQRSAAFTDKIIFCSTGIKC